MLRVFIKTNGGPNHRQLGLALLNHPVGLGTVMLMKGLIYCFVTVQRQLEDFEKPQE